MCGQIALLRARDCVTCDMRSFNKKPRPPELKPLYSSGTSGWYKRQKVPLTKVSEAQARKMLGGVVGARLVRELQGYPCAGLHPSKDGTLARQSLGYLRQGDFK